MEGNCRLWATMKYGVLQKKKIYVTGEGFRLKVKISAVPDGNILLKSLSERACHLSVKLLSPARSPFILGLGKQRLQHACDLS